MEKPNEVTALIENDKIIAHLLKLAGNKPYHAVANFSMDNRLIYTLVEAPITPELVKKHLAGDITLGIYQIDPADNTVNWICFDIDAPEQKTAKSIAREIRDSIGANNCIVEFSGRKGFHVWILLDEPVLAAEAKEFAEAIRNFLGLRKTGEIHVECFPKQSKIRKKSTSDRRVTGNLVKLPLGIHPVSKNRSVFVSLEDDSNKPLDPIYELSKVVSWNNLKSSVNLRELAIKTLERIVISNWIPGQRHELALALSGFLAKSAWGKDKIQNFLTVVCEHTGDDELANRMQAVEDTFYKLDVGEEIVGYSGLQRILGEETATRLSKIVTNLEFVTTHLNGNVVAEIRKIRLKKIQLWLKELEAMELVWRYMIENGRILKSDTVTGNGEIVSKIYWFDSKRKVVIPVRPDNSLFAAIFFSKFGINPLDSFGQHTIQMLMLKASLEAESVEVKKRSYFDQENFELYLYWGGEKIWILDGDEIKSEDNGSENVFFLSSFDKNVYPDFDHPVDIWKFLFEAVNFQRTGDTPIPPEEQLELLKAWFVSFFFRELLPTRPILALLGPAGSGKTTIARQILRIVTHPKDDVLDLQEDKPDSLRVSLESRQMIVLDNLEKFGGNWLLKRLLQAATGSVIELRELYKTNTPYLIDPDTYIVLTAVTVPFTEETFFERLLVLTLDKLEYFKPSHLFDQELISMRDRVLADLILKLNIIVKEIQAIPPPLSVGEVRMADFVSFCYRIMPFSEQIGINPVKLQSGLSLMRRGQAKALSRSEHSILPLLEKWVRSEPGEAAKPHTAAELLDILLEQSKKSGKATPRFFRSPQALANHLNAMREVLAKELNAQFEERYVPAKGRNQILYSFYGWSLKEEE